MTNDQTLIEKAQKLMAKLDLDAEGSGYHLNPDQEMVLELCKGLVQNIETYGYMGCPCRLMDGKRINDLDVICPCDYRDPDLNQFGMCYCALYVTKAVAEEKREAECIPERRPSLEDIRATAKKRRENPASVSVKTWRCKVCGYLCARELPPDECPICLAEKDRFETFSFK